MTRKFIDVRTGTPAQLGGKWSLEWSDVVNALPNSGLSHAIGELVELAGSPAHGFAIVVQVAPVYDPATQIATEVQPVQIGGVWTQQWTIAARSAQDIAAAYQATIPQSVTMRQARLALLNAGLLTTVNNAVATVAGAAGDAARIEWEFSSEVFRHRPLVVSLGTSLGLTDAQLDALFVAAAAL